jgi:hypothetical protein
MRLEDASKYLKKNVDELEKSVFMFDEVVKPRAEADKVILRRLRDQQVKLDALLKKVKAGEEPSIEEFNECVPHAFRGGA